VTRAYFVKKARKNYPKEGIKKGQEYWHWKFRRCEKRRSKTRPKPSQLTRSEYLGTLYGIREELEVACEIFDGMFAGANVDSDGTDVDGELSDFETERETLAGAFTNAAEQIRDLGNDAEEKLENLPDNLRDSPTGELLRSRAERCEVLAADLENKAGDVERLELADESDGYAAGLVADADWGSADL
jgi:hypothetical protein